MALDGASGAGGADTSGAAGRGGSNSGVGKAAEDRVSAAMEQARASRSDSGDDGRGGGSRGSGGPDGSDRGSGGASPGAGAASASARDASRDEAAARAEADRQADARRGADRTEAAAKDAAASEARASQARLEAEGQAAKRSYEARLGAGPFGGAERATRARQAAPAAPDRDWTRAERAALDRGTARGAADAGTGWVADVVGGAVEAAVTAGQAAVVGAETMGEASAALRGTELGRAVLRSNPVIDLAARAYEGVAALIPDAFADRQADALAAKGAAVIEELRALPEMPRAVIEKLDADIALADALEGAYRAGRADLAVLEESARVRAQAHGEAAILAAEVASLGAGGAGAAIRAARTLGRLDIDAPDGAGGLTAALAQGAERSRNVSGDVRAFVANRPDAVLDRSTFDAMRADRDVRSPVSVPRSGTPDRLDQMIGAPAMRPSGWNAVMREADALGVRVERLSPQAFADWVHARGGDPEAVVGGFDPRTGTVALRQDATDLEAFHELHHARQWREIGPEAYGDLRSTDREVYVRDAILGAGDRFSDVQRGQAMHYVVENADRSGVEHADIPLPDGTQRSDYEAYLERILPEGRLSYDRILKLDRIFGR